MDELDNILKKGDAISAGEIESLNKLVSKRYRCEDAPRRVVNLKTMELSFVKAKHALVDSEDDFV
jgi:hypothetical protein